MLFCSAFQVDVIVELRPMEDDVLLHRDVVLVLKCAKSVNWVIKSHSVRGKLVIEVRQQQKWHHTTAARKKNGTSECVPLPLSHCQRRWG